VFNACLLATHTRRGAAHRRQHRQAAAAARSVAKPGEANIEAAAHQANHPDAGAPVVAREMKGPAKRSRPTAHRTADIIDTGRYGETTMIARAPFVVFAAVLFVTLTQANAKNFAAVGIGLSTCTEFANLYKLDAETAENRFFSWAQGFMSGYDFAQRDNTKNMFNLALMETKEQQAFLRSYCDQHPLGDYFDAVTHLMIELQARETIKR
jgi:hypothetical protein